MAFPAVTRNDSVALEPTVVALLPPVQSTVAKNSAAPPLGAAANRIPALDGLRGIAILLVLMRHSVAGFETHAKFWSRVLQPLQITWSGVDLFFVLSGFLIGGILLESRHSPRYFRTFYIRRLFRIFPIYYIFLAIYFARHLLVVLPGSLGNSSPLLIPWFSFVTFTHNFWMASVGWFGPWGIAQTWSLAIEEQFYLTVPVLIRTLSTRSLYRVLACIIIGAPLLRVILPHSMQHGAFANYVLMPCRADALSFGVLSALLYRSTKFKACIAIRPWVLQSIVGITGAAILYLSYLAPNQYTPPMATWGFSCLALFYACVLLSVVCGAMGTLDRVLRFTAFRELGKVAYCTYLIHPPIMQAARALLRAHTTIPAAEIWPIGGLLGIAFVLPIAAFSWKFLEKPLLTYGHRYKY